MKYVSFHTHTTHSHGDGFGTVKEHIARVKELGMKSVAFSEHGNCNSWVALEQEAKDNDIKPIFGVEAYFSPPNERRKFHITLFAMDDVGLRNINRIITQSWIDFYQYPTVTWASLKQHSKGVVAFSGCADSLISCTLLGGKSLGEKRLDYSDKDYNKTLKRVKMFQDVFEDRFYLEVQRFPGLPRTCVLNPAFAEIGNEVGAQLIASSDVHYPFPHQNRMQQVLHAARRSSSVAVSEAEWEYNILLTYPQSDKEIFNDLRNTGLSRDNARSAIINTANLAKICTVELPKAEPLRFRVPSGYRDSQHYFKKAVVAGLQYRINQRPEIKDNLAAYRKRINHEFKIIAGKDFCDYFLVLSDLIIRAKSRGTVIGPARGSAAASLIAYVLRITEVDPLHPAFNRMIFERFIDPNRSDMPDIDLDFDDEKRNQTAIDAQEVYGGENIANVGNHIKYRGRKALQDVARAYGLSTKTFDAIGQRCTIRVETDDRVDDSIADVIESYQNDPSISSLLEEPSYANKIIQAAQLEGNQHSMGIHAGGFVISSEPIPNVCAIYTREKGSGRHKDKAQVIPYDKRDAEYLGMLKMDFLGLTTCGMLGKIVEWEVITLEDLYALFYREYEQQHVGVNERIMGLFQIDDVVGLFQYEGGTTRELCRQVRPENFDQLAAVGALSRPGPYYGGQAEAYVKVKNGEMEWERVHENFDKHVEWTFGQIVYQEQIMFILRDLAGFSTERVLKVRKIIGKKLGEFQFAALWEEFKDGCAHNGVSEASAEKVWSGITTAAGYAFNVAHAYSYALIAWWQAYIKIWHPAEFYAASLYKNGDGKDNIPRRTALLQDAMRHRIHVSEFSPWESGANWFYGKYYEGDCIGRIIPGFQQIDGIGEATASDIVSWRETMQAVDKWWMPEWSDLVQVKGIGAKTVEKIQAFALQDDPLGITRTQDQLLEFRRQLEDGEFDETGIPSAEEFRVSSDLPEDDDYAAFVGLVANIVYRDEIETIRTRTGQSIEEIKASMDDSDKTKKATIFSYDEFGEVALRVSRWQYPKLADRISNIKEDHHLIVGWGKYYAGRGRSIQIRSLWVFDPD